MIETVSIAVIGRFPRRNLRMNRSDEFFDCRTRRQATLSGYGKKV
jgi:hypothetical protein